MGSIATLPVWKKGASPADRLEELASLAREFPERFEQFVIVFEEKRAQPRRWITRTHRFDIKGPDQDMDVVSAIGLLELGKDNLIKASEP